MHKKSTNSILPEFEPPSRSELKRQSAALQKLGEELARLSPALWRNFSISPQLLEALSEHGKIKSREGKRRQLQFIGRLMRTENSEQISAELDRLKAAHSLHTARFHELEQLRDQILQSTPDIWRELELKLAESRPDLSPEAREAELKLLRQLAGNDMQKQDKSGSRALFKALRTLMGSTENYSQNNDNEPESA